MQLYKHSFLYQLALIAASRAKHHKIHNNQIADLDPEVIKKELLAARKLKLETKLEDTPKDKKPKKEVSEEDLKLYEKELEILKNIELDSLVDRTLKKKLQKHPELKDDELIKDTIISSLNTQKTDDLTVQNIESRLLANKSINAEVAENINGFYTIIKGNIEKIEQRKQEAQKRKEAEEAKKRKLEENGQNPKMKRSKTDASSEFTDSLGIPKGPYKYDETKDEFFQKIYEGKKKPNRPGQRQRRKQWEELYGKDAKHIQSEYEKREEKRRAKPDYKPPKKKQAPAAHRTKAAPAASAEPVHPSWEAKRMQEEIMSKALSGEGPKNNKIVFSDD
ncbi:hypothetical protein BDF20DRAFT_928362 [Mycotypha africana]|uniref:uncharacterized protein n=1 Tax=Mycotypha africana TaxID=64632 RepID=UPI002301C1A1|nr:uncharacterized protein BDF20DRAFT_928362 [Mycotypha africana]KAI8967453.1 hypothetical protein BDF20DRAFT_928362 [Mycotypha africana]